MVWIERSMCPRPSIPIWLIWEVPDPVIQSRLYLAYNPKYQIWCESDAPYAQDPSITIWLIWKVPGPEDNFWKCYLELAFKPKYQMWCESAMCPRCRYTGLVYMGGTRSREPFSITNGPRLIEAYLQSLKFVALCVRTQSWLLRTDGRTDGQTDIAQMSQINIFMRPTRTDKTQIAPMRRV